jgi:hypothetical protein
MQTRLAIYRWGWVLAALIALTVAFERRGGEPPPPPTPVVAPAPPPPAYVVLDHVPLRRVTLGSGYVEPPAGYHPPTLTVRGERPYYFGHTVGGWSPLPAWIEPHHGDQPVTTLHRELDDSWLAIADTTVILIDRDHHAEVGLDFGWFRMFASHNADRVVVVEAHRVGTRVIAYGTDPEGGPFLASIDIATGTSAWVVQLHSDSVPGFAVSHGTAITSEYVDEHPALVVRELVSAGVVGTVATKDGQYTLDTRADGSLHGVVEALAEDGYTSEIDVSVE